MLAASSRDFSFDYEIIARPEILVEMSSLVVFLAHLQMYFTHGCVNLGLVAAGVGILELFGGKE